MNLGVYKVSDIMPSDFKAIAVCISSGFFIYKKVHVNYMKIVFRAFVLSIFMFPLFEARAESRQEKRPHWDPKWSSCDSSADCTFMILKCRWRKGVNSKYKPDVLESLKKDSEQYGLPCPESPVDFPDLPASYYIPVCHEGLCTHAGGLQERPLP